MYDAGEIQVSRNWKRLAIDVTHYRNEVYLSMVDCGPGRFAIWKRIRGETAEVISTVLEEVFLKRGPVTEVLMDNGRAFRSATLKEMLDNMGCEMFFQCSIQAERPWNCYEASPDYQSFNRKKWDIAAGGCV